MLRSIAIIGLLIGACLARAPPLGKPRFASSVAANPAPGVAPAAPAPVQYRPPSPSPAPVQYRPPPPAPAPTGRAYQAPAPAPAPTGRAYQAPAPAPVPGPSAVSVPKAHAPAPAKAPVPAPPSAPAPQRAASVNNQLDPSPGKAPSTPTGKAIFIGLF